MAVLLRMSRVEEVVDELLHHRCVQLVNERLNHTGVCVSESGGDMIWREGAAAAAAVLVCLVRERPVLGG